MSNIETNTQNSEKFAVSAITPWIKGTMDVDSHYLTVNLPNTVFFELIPAGKRKDRTPISGITSMHTDRKYKLGKILLGALIVLSTIGNIGNSPVGSIVLILLGALLFASGIVTTFSYERSGVTQTITFPFFESNHVEQFEQHVSEIVSAYQDDRNVRMHSEKNAQTIVDGINNKK